MKNIRRIGVIGTGMIGASMAALFTGNGYRTIVYAVDEAQKQRGLKIYEQCYQDLIANGLMDQEQYQICRELLTIVCSYEELKKVEFVFECVLEQTAVKHEVYQKLEKYCPDIRAIASSTSAISADELAEGLERKELLAVAHPWNPPHLAPCVEVVRSRYTGNEALELILAVLEDTGKEVVVLKKGIPGFIGNRLQYAMFREAVYLVEQGIADPEEIDRTLKFSFAPRYTSIGIFEHFDNCGLDLAKDIEDYLFPSLCNDGSASSLIKERCEAGEYGVKSKKGMIDWKIHDPLDMQRRAAAPFTKFFNWKLPRRGI